MERKRGSLEQCCNFTAGALTFSRFASIQPSMARNWIWSSVHSWLALRPGRLSALQQLGTIVE